MSLPLASTSALKIWANSLENSDAGLAEAADWLEVQGFETVDDLRAVILPTSVPANVVRLQGLAGRGICCDVATIVQLERAHTPVIQNRKVPPVEAKRITARGKKRRWLGSAALKLNPQSQDESRRSALAEELVDLSFSWAPAAGLLCSLPMQGGLMKLRRRRLCIRRISAFEAPSLRQHQLCWASVLAWAKELKIPQEAWPLSAGILEDFLETFIDKGHCESSTDSH